jgi:putative FmdB family regulatory protein
MPTYEYACDKCGAQFEKFQSMKDAALTVCPKDLCGQKRWGRGRVRRLLGTGAGLLFKGSGFYITDYRSESYKQAAKKDAPAVAPALDAKAADAKAAGAGPAKAATDSKPAAKTAPAKAD